MIKTQTQNQDKATKLLYLNKSKRITSLIGLIVSMKNLIDMQEEVDPFQVLVSVLILLVIIENNRYVGWHKFFEQVWKNQAEDLLLVLAETF